jgi:hypothetical protein
MEANELRIGNYFTEFKEVKQVSGIESFPTVVVWDYTGCECLLFEPIPLTEEWLVKFGFEKDSTRTFSHRFTIECQKSMLVLRPSCFGGYYFGIASSDSMGTDVELDDVLSYKYVHQLQNLYHSLTGTELKTVTI